MANSITLFKAYIDMLDEVYKEASKTSMLDISGSLVKAGSNANEIVIPKISMDGLADYRRNSGYVQGDVSLTNETVKFDYDRGRSFTVDAMDNDESAGIAFGRLASEFMRTRTVPELDAYRFAKYASTPGITSVSKSLTTGEAALAAISAANNEMDEQEVSADGRYLFITPTLRNIIEMLDTYKSKSAMSVFSQITSVPQSRFYTKIKLKSGTATGEEAGGFEKDTTGANINFMIIQKDAAIQYSKHTVTNVFSPEENQTADAWKFNYRSYGLCTVYENRTAGIYVNYAPTSSR